MGYWTDKRVVVTGGAGFLGSHVLEKLREAGCPHIFVVRSKDYDVTKEESVARLFADLEAAKHGWPAAVGGRRSAVDVLIHLAWLVGGIGANKARPAEFFYQNLMMNTLTLHYAWKHGVEKVVAAAAGCGYPEHAPMPLKEVVETLAEITGLNGEIVWDTSRPDGQARRVFDVSKARRELGFEARTSLREGLKQTVSWYRDHRAEARNVPALTP